MKPMLYCCILLALTACVAIWRIGTPVDGASCPGSPVASGPLSEFIDQYVNDSQGADWRDNGGPLGILQDPAAQAIVQRPEAHYCEALALLADPQRSETQKVHATALMLALPIDHYLGWMDATHGLYQHGAIGQAVMQLVVFPRSTALDYWWLPQWRSRFQRDAPGLYDPAFVTQVLNGQHWFSYPGQGY
ncbi:hypothetical protein B7H20_35090 [Pseudomonas aeruginosa]|uniref:hypothetical protein n=1 Tax=Pseudomonas aeruginosa TaxID=287 RepID=UPI000A10B531|nr:hypothetical protein [Pseudomonas aeruginosa]ORL52270.1 hypothetical protein B7H20_35090 [Pseudomonas aeruginosa]